MTHGAAFRFPRPWRGLLVLPILLAVALACAPTDPRTRARALFNDAIRLAEHSPEPIRSFQLERIVAQMAPLDPQGASHLVEKIQDDGFRDVAYTDIVREIGKTDPENALLIAGRIHRAGWNSRAMAAAIEAIVPSDPGRALNLALKLPPNQSSDYLLDSVLVGLAARDPDRAETLALQTPDEWRRSRRLLLVARSLSNAHPERALRILRRLIGRRHPFYDECRSWSDAVLSLGRQDLPRAISEARKTPSECFPSNLMMDLAVSLSDLNQGASLLQQVNDKRMRVVGYAELAVKAFPANPEQATAFLGKAEAECRQMKVPSWRDESGVDVILTLTRYDPSIAAKWIDRFSSPGGSLRIGLLFAMAQQAVAKDPALALAILNKMPDGSEPRILPMEVLGRIEFWNNDGRGLRPLDQEHSGDIWAEYYSVHRLRATALSSFAKELPGDRKSEARRALEDALKDAMAVPMTQGGWPRKTRETLRFDAIADVLGDMYAVDPARAKEEIDKVNDPYLRGYLLAGAAVTLAERNGALALHLIQSVQTPQLRWTGMERVAKKIALRDPDHGWQVFRDAIRLQQADRSASGLRSALEQFQKDLKAPVPPSAYRYYYEAAALARRERDPEELARIAADLWHLSAPDKPVRTG